MVQFYVINWDVNKDCIEHYDVIPYLYSEIERKRKREKIAKKDLTYKWLRKTIEDSSRYMYWSRCEYEVIVHAWPAYRNDYKLDIHEQVMMNLDNITELIYNDYHKIKPTKAKINEQSTKNSSLYTRYRGRNPETHWEKEGQLGYNQKGFRPKISW